MNRKLYFDEAGFTGSNINNKNQPVFCLASLCLNNDEMHKIEIKVKELREKHRLDFKEMHFAKLKESGSGRSFIIDLLEYLVSDSLDNIFVHFVEKEYALYCNVVDRLIEPFLRFELDVDINVEKYNIATACVLMLMMRTHDEQNDVAEFRAKFEVLMRDINMENISSFKDVVLKIYSSTDSEDLKRTLELILACLDDQSLFKADDKYNLDLTFTTFIASIEFWRNQHQESQFDVYFDNSRAIESYQSWIDRLSADTVKKQMVGYDDRKHMLPLPINQFSLSDSEEYIGLQLADILASTVFFCNTAQKKKQETFKKKLVGLIGGLKCHLMTLNVICRELLDNTEIDSSEDVDGVDFIADLLSELDD